MRNILLFCAHPDDEVIGAGGTILNYAKKGVHTHVVIFSGGERSNVWYKAHKLTQKRANESKKAGEILQTKSIKILGLIDGKLSQEVQKKEVKEKIKKIILQKKPEKILTHAIDDMLYPDHRAVHECVMSAAKEIKKEIPIYTFNIWTINVRKRNTPKLLVDITHEFEQKMKAIGCFKTQYLAIFQLKPVIYIKALLSGWRHGTKFAEEFNRIL